jgi:hypothetical protein
MPMLPAFRKSEVKARCDACRAVFDPVHGGVCESCRRLLCATHVFGSLRGTHALESLFRRLQSYVPGTHLVCPECRDARRRGTPIPRAPNAKTRA